LRELSAKATQIAGGDLSVEIDGGSSLGSGFKQMLDNLRALVREISSSVVQLNSASEQILATTKRQEEGAMAQSSAVEETRRTLESLLSSGKRIGEASESVLHAAERAHQNNQLIGKRIGQLTARTEAIGEVLETIKTIASKSDLLALNAALEGTKAGEAGRGFSLVANQMQRLTENVVDAVKDIKGLTQHIQEATNATVLATEEGIKQASEVTQAARQISLIIRQQQSGIEQTTQSVNDISDVAQNAAAGSSQTTAAIADLVELSRKLQRQVETFRLGS
jgi:methyl-accepting chemotaxis protein